jgi:hypothetical protein
MILESSYNALVVLLEHFISYLCFNSRYSNTCFSESAIPN